VVEAARAADPQRPVHVITQATEHNAVLDPCKWLAKQGCRVTVLDVNATGRVRMEDLRRAMAEQAPLIVSIMVANNEIGTIQPIEEIGALCRERGVLFHTDAAQAAGKVSIDVDRSGIDLLSISGHKIYAPKGVGALYVRKRSPRIAVAEQMHGGGHERGMRSGTLNVPAIVGLGAACALAAAEMAAESKRIAALRDRLQAKIEASVEGVRVNGDVQHRLPGNLNITFEHVDSESLMVGLRDVALSSGSACTSAKIEASHVLRAIGLDDQTAHSSIRFGIGRFNTEEETDFVAERLAEVVRRLRELSPVQG
jgi:cysteine desulfurase